MIERLIYVDMLPTAFLKQLFLQAAIYLCLENTVSGTCYRQTKDPVECAHAHRRKQPTKMRLDGHLASFGVCSH